MDENELKDYVLQKKKEGKIVLRTFDGFGEANLEDFLTQPAEGILYDLNRDGATTLTFLDDPKWTNDFAVGLVITELKMYYDAYMKLVDTLKKKGKDINELW